MAACERCPSPGACTACPFLRRPLTGEFGKKRLTVNTLEEVPKEFKGIINFNPVRQEGGELPIPIRTSKETETCSKCQKPASTCSHSKSKTSALAA